MIINTYTGISTQLMQSVCPRKDYEDLEEIGEANFGSNETKPLCFKINLLFNVEGQELDMNLFIDFHFINTLTSVRIFIDNLHLENNPDKDYSKSEILNYKKLEVFLNQVITFSNGIVNLQIGENYMKFVGISRMICKKLSFEVMD